MNKHLYALCVFLLGLSAISSLLQHSVYLFLGNQIFTLDSFIWWFLFSSLIVLANGLFLLKYYNFRAYRGALITGAISVVAGFAQMVALLIILSTMQHQEYYSLASIINIVASIIHATALVFSKTKEQRFLKYGGIFSFFLGLIFLLIFTLALPSSNPDIRLFAQKISEWVLFLSPVGPLLFALNYTDEIKALKTKHGVSDQDVAENWISAIKIVAFLCSLAFGFMLAKDGYMSFYWKSHNSQQTEALKQLSDVRSFKDSKGDSLQYLLIKPQPYDPDKNYPLVVCLPYDKFEGASLAQILTSDVNRKKYPAFLFVPYCPPGSGWGGIPGYPTIDTLVFEAISSLDREQRIDTSRRYVTGISRGGYGSWNFITKRPDMFAAAIPVCGGGNPQLAEQIVDVSVWAFHGAKDKNVPVNGSRDMIEGIKQAGGNPRYTEYPDEAHNIWHRVSQTPDLLEWLFAQAKTDDTARQH